MCILINTSPNVLNGQTAKNLKKRPFFSKETALSWCRLEVMFGGNLENSRSCILNTKVAAERETCEKIYF